MSRLTPAYLGAISQLPPEEFEAAAAGLGIGSGQFGALNDMFGQAVGLGSGDGTLDLVPTGKFQAPFMSYPAQATPLNIDGADGLVIEELSFEGLVWPDRPITIQNSNNVTLRKIDSRRCSMGLAYIFNCTNIFIDEIRCENITGPHERPGGENRGNVFQFNGVNGYTVTDIKARYGDTEDAFSFFDARNGTAHRLHWEGAIVTDRPTTDGGDSLIWESSSGTGAILGDGEGFNNYVADSIFINPGQVGIAIACGDTQQFENCIVVSEGGSSNPDPPNPPGWENIAAYSSPQASPCLLCTNHLITNCRTQFSNGNNIWTDGDACAPVDLTGSVFGDPSLNIEDYRVTL